MSNYWTNNELFDKYTEKLGSPFAATVVIAAQARKRAEACGNRISHASALSWVITGEMPKELMHPSKRVSKKQQAINYVEDYIDTYVSDDDVAESVYKSIQESMDARHLIYFYKECLDIHRQARVRIICNILWDKIW